MNTSSTAPLHAGVFNDSETAAQAVTELRAAGFTHQEISVISSDREGLRKFESQDAEDVSDEKQSSAVGTAGAAGLGLGGAAIAAGAIATGGVPLMVVGAFAGIAAAGTFAALMLNRGMQPELSDFYEQALLKGQFLVVVEPRSHRTPAELQRADQILKRGTESIHLNQEA